MPKLASHSSAAADPPAVPTDPVEAKSDTVETEAIDSEWPDDPVPAVEALTSPRIPPAAKLPSAAKPARSPTDAGHANTVAFEAAASALANKHGSFAVPGAGTEPRESETHYAGESLAPSQKDSRHRAAGAKRRGKGLWLGLAAAAFVVAGIGLSVRSPERPMPKLERAQNALRPESAKADSDPAAKTARKGVKPNPVTAADAEQATDTERGAGASESVDSSASAVPAEPESQTVKVNIVPPDTQIYHKGKFLGTSGEAIEVPRGERMLLVLIRDGFWPRKLILDGKETVYNVGLREQPPPTFLPQAPNSEAATNTVAPDATQPAAAAPAPGAPAAQQPGPAP
jgi:hypothetical protein